MADILKENLQRVARAFAPDESTWWRIGHGAMGRTAQPKELIGRTGPFHVQTYDRLMIYLSANWPAGVEWPVDVPRPVIKKRRGGA